MADIPQNPPDSRNELVNEATPLVSHQNGVYDRFSRKQKRNIVAMVACCGIIPFFVAGTFIPSIPQVAKDLDTTGAVISFAISLSVFAASVGSLCGSAYSTYYGRRAVYFVGLPLLVVGSFGVAGTHSVPELMIWRFIQAFGAFPAISVGAAVVGDIYTVEERGTAMGIYFSIVLLGPGISPLIGGFMTHYVSWRAMQALLGITTTFLLIWVVVALPETSHPGARGVDKARAEGKKPSWFVNPLRPLALLRSPNILFVSLAGSFVLLTDFVLMVPIAYTIGERYGISNEFLIGACFLPSGAGSMIGAPLAGRLSDRIIIRWRQKRGKWYPEDRLRATLLGALVFTPLSILFCGLLTEYVPGTLGLVLNLICLFFNGIGVDLVLSVSAAYLVDVLQDRSAESLAASDAFRSFVMSFAISAVLPSIDRYGVAVTDAISAISCWLGCGMIWLVIIYGEQMRTWCDIGFKVPTEEN
ncbi:MFS general substrate transporter [Pluteus cervinus]|uniref:MFS general substrate transporter n=1 Tax=Pluteus cervinus TaxID=181527 RepID=A0ACD3AHY8_9AGAR|nr:MFS general substrate transporter [Pluteus cervinus]